MAESQNWWKKVPCHFVWKLENDTTVDYTSIRNNLESKLDDYIDMDKDIPPSLLLFISYIEVSRFREYKEDPESALSFLMRAENKAKHIINDDERKAYFLVSRANRLWIIEKFSKSGEEKKDDLLKSMKVDWTGLEDMSKFVLAHIDYIAGFALSRLGPYKYPEAERRLRQSVSVYSDKSEWYRHLGEIVGRQARMKTKSRSEFHEDMNEEIELYKKALELDPSNDHLRCDLALALVNKPGSKGKADDLISSTKHDTCAVIIKKGRYYRQQKQFTIALDMLKKGELLPNPRAEIFLQISLVYSSLAWEAGGVRDFDLKNKYTNKEIAYLDLCLEIEPTRLTAKLNKARALGKKRLNREAADMYRNIIQDQIQPRDLVEAKFQFAGFLVSSNRRQVTMEAANLYEDVVNICVKNFRQIDGDGNDIISGDGGLLAKAKECLEGYYRKTRNTRAKLEDLEKTLKGLKL